MTAKGSGLLPVRRHEVPRGRRDSMLDDVEFAIAEIADGRPVVVVDDEDRENEGDIIFAASLAAPGVVAFTVRYSSGYICAPVSEEIADRLELIPQTRQNQDVRGTAYTVTVDATAVASTGISAVDRAFTLQELARTDATPSDFRRPGHVVPLRARKGGVLVRAGHTEAAIDLVEMAGLPAAGVICEIVSERDPLEMARTPELRDFCDENDLALISIAQLIAHRSRVEHQVERVAIAEMPLVQGRFAAHGYRSTITGREVVALVLGEIGDGSDVLVRVHSECTTGDVFHALRCACGRRLQAGLDAIGLEGRGVLLYLRGHEGTGMDLLTKLRNYQAQDEGSDAPTPRDVVDPKGYGTGAQILVDLGIRSMIMLSDHPVKRAGLDGYGLTLSGVQPLGVDSPHSRR